MVKRIIIILFLLTASAQAECKYYAEADVINEVLVNKKEHFWMSYTEKMGKERGEKGKKEKFNERNTVREIR